ncbi:ABC transporter permease [Corynebacterium sp. ACRPX]|uniref:ABC transporter permease n=1 Tax=Corynebacterium sp. ACRPX TaxID=2918185 RepID=UPI001EF50201|nr:ABC transporter permease [Corynebacterium sp. ACRPX]MCG7245622.1 ABC transporter permease [Corynebacterium sp. ACRPX]
MFKVALHYFRIDRAAWASCAGILLLLTLLSIYELQFKPYLGMTEMLAGIVPMFVGIVWSVALFSREFETKSSVWALSQDFSPSKWFVCRMVSPLTSALVFGICVWGIVELSQIKSSSLGSAKNMMSYSYIAGHAFYPALVTILMVSIAALVGVLLKKAIPSIAITFALGLVLCTTGASWLNPLLPIAKGKFKGGGPDGSILPVPGEIISSKSIDNGNHLVEFYPNTAFWDAQILYASMWAFLSILLIGFAFFLFKQTSRRTS